MVAKPAIAVARRLINRATMVAPRIPEKRAIYDQIGAGYASRRQPDPRIAATLRAALGEATCVINVGAGAGSYEPSDITAAAVEPSAVMARQRPPELVPAVLASAERLPFVDASFDGALAVLTIHHWRDTERGLRELRRVTAGPIVILTFDAEVGADWWLPRVYAPELKRLFAEDTRTLRTLRRALGEIDVRVLPVPAECRDGFLMAFWDRPEMVLDPVARAATSGFARLSLRTQAEICQRLEGDLQSGEWDRRFGHLRKLEEFDSGLRLVVAQG